MRTNATFAAVICLLGFGAVANDAGAQSRKPTRRGEIIVTAESRFGHGTVSGPVRLAPAGNYEVRTPGGSWLSCSRSCAETLRVETIDFWENKGRGESDRIDNVCGSLGCLSGGLRY